MEENLNHFSNRILENEKIKYCNENMDSKSLYFFKTCNQLIILLL